MSESSRHCRHLHTGHLHSIIIDAIDRKFLPIFLEKPGGYRCSTNGTSAIHVPLMQDDKIEMEFCKGSDLALQMILAIVSTIERASIKAEYSG